MDTIVERYGTYKGYDYLVLRIRGMHLCAYVRIPETHDFYGKEYDDIPIECHGGLTFCQMTDFELPDISNGYWIGWDYAHVGDWTPLMPNENDKKWTPDEVVLEAKQVIEQLIQAGL